MDETRRRYYVAEQDDATNPVWSDNFAGQMLHGIALQQLKGSEWQTTKLILSEDLKSQEAAIKANEDASVTIEFVTAPALLGMVSE